MTEGLRIDSRVSGQGQLVGCYNKYGNNTVDSISWREFLHQYLLQYHHNS